jgi:DNA polymerase-3 subunit gamma/tau
MLNALAASDGAALMACVAQLDERAPDYDQALGELAAAIQRMALLQALPDLRGEDEEQDVLLAGLAAQFSPEDLQLLYQIAIMARRDLDFAPDARGGFEMALLRMLAFRPEQAGSSAPATSAASAPRRAAPASATTVTQVRGGATASPATGVPGTPRAVAAGADDWLAIVAQLGLTGSTAQLAAHCALVGRSGGVVRLELDRAGEAFRRPQLEQRLAQALERFYGEAVRLDLRVSDGVEVTPARLQAQAADERQKAAEQAIEADANVRAMRAIFGATVVPGSVKPLN